MPGNNLPNGVWLTGTAADGVSPRNLVRNNGNSVELGDGTQPVVVSTPSNLIDANSQNFTVDVNVLAGGKLDGIQTHNSQTAGGTATMPSGAAVDAAYPGWIVGTARSFAYVNYGNQTVTFANGANMIGKNLANTVLAGGGATIVVRKTGVATYEFYILR